nr:unnamed protein product [Digitaria exilis]
MDAMEWKLMPRSSIELGAARILASSAGKATGISSSVQMQPSSSVDLAFAGFSVSARASTSSRAEDRHCFVSPIVLRTWQAALAQNSTASATRHTESQPPGRVAGRPDEHYTSPTSALLCSLASHLASARDKQPIT